MSEFTITDAVRGVLPAFIAIVGPPGSGKTPSALRLATGMARVYGGKIGLIDSEALRALHYAPRKGEKADLKNLTFDFKHLDLLAPHGADRYQKAIEQLIAEGCKVIIVDSISHEHIGIGGCLEEHARITKDLAARWKCTEGKASQSAWNFAKMPRKQLINKLEQMRGVAFIFCFRAKENTDFEKKGADMDRGWEPEGGKEIFFHMGLTCLLPERAEGVPVWNSNKVGEKRTTKLAFWAKDIFRESKQLDEETGEKLAKWLSGGETTIGTPSANIPTAASTANASEWETKIRTTKSLADLIGVWNGVQAIYTQFNKTDMDSLLLAKEEMKAYLKEKESA